MEVIQITACESVWENLKVVTQRCIMLPEETKHRVNVILDS